MKKNILLITTDQHHYSCMGYNNEDVKTPNLDKLAREGMIFDRCYCPNPTCTPSRASIITGTYPSQHGAWSLGTKLPENIPVVGDHFQKANYRTALVGKAHFQPTVSTEQYPSIESNEKEKDEAFWKTFKHDFYGFQDIDMSRHHGISGVGQHYALWLEEKGLKNFRDYFRPETKHIDGYKWDIPEEFHYNSWITEKTNGHLEEYCENEDNFFLWASFPDPHPPCTAPEPWTSMYKNEALAIPQFSSDEHEKNPPHFQLTQKVKPDRSMYVEKDGHDCHGVHSHLNKHNRMEDHIAAYLGTLSMTDHYIGKILDKLEALGLKDNTLVVFTTDHGHFFGQHGLMGKGAFHYEDMIKIPCIARLPGLTPNNSRTNALISLVDLAPTFLDIAGIEIPRSMTGISQKDVLSLKEKNVRDHILVENHHQPTTLHLKTYVNERYKITVYYNQTYGELFDLESDPEEKNNLWDNPDFSDLKQELFLKYIHAELGKEPMWMPRLATA
jgi:arylsulfatase A-like enzyme